MLIRGQGDPSGRVGGAIGGASVQGQPVLPGGGGGRSARVADVIIPKTYPKLQLAQHFALGTLIE